MSPPIPDISLIVVFHNAEATIERTLKSLATQTLQSVEYLFVNDGSTDMSVKVIEGFKLINPDFATRNKLITSPVRRGSAHATTLGLENATGRYVMRCDADDYLEPDTLATLLDATDGEDNSIIMCPYILESAGKSKTIRWKSYPHDLNDFAIDTLNFSLCNKLLPRKLLTSNRIFPYDGIDCWEDLGVVARLMALKPQIRIVDRPLYHYVRNAGTLSHSGRGRLLEDHLQTALLLEQWFNQHSLDKRYEEFLNHLKFCSKVKMMRGWDKDVKRWKRTFPEVNRRILGLRHISLRYRLLFTATAILPSRFTQWVSDTISAALSYFKPADSCRRNDSTRNR